MIVKNRKSVLILKSLSRINTAILVVTDQQPSDKITDQLVHEYKMCKAKLKESLQDQIKKFTNEKSKN